MIHDGPLGTVIAKANVGNYIVQNPFIHQGNTPYWIRFVSSKLSDLDEAMPYIPLDFVMYEYSINLLEYDLSAIGDINKDYAMERLDYIK